MSLNVSNVVKITIAAVIGILILKFIAARVNIPVVSAAVGKV